MLESRRILLENEKDLSNSYNDHQNVFREICERDMAVLVRPWFSIWIVSTTTGR